MENKETPSLLELLKTERLKTLEECAVELYKIRRMLQRYFQDMYQEPALLMPNEAREAWNKVIQKINTEGSYKTVAFDDLIIHAAIIDMGGWVYLCGLTKQALFSQASVFEMYYMKYRQCPPTHYPIELKGRLS